MLADTLIDSSPKFQTVLNEVNIAAPAGCFVLIHEAY